MINQPLSTDQGAPLGFIYITKKIVNILGNKDYVLRIIPVISGILVIICAYFLSQTVYKTKLGRLVFIALMAFSPILIYYSSEFKQYSLDVLVTTILLLVALTYQKIKYGEFLLAVIGSICIWFSFPSLFILAAIGVVQFIDELRQKHIGSVARLVLVGIIWVVSFLGVNFLSLRKLSVNQYLIDYWKPGYAPFPIHSFADIWWYIESFLGLIYLAFQQSMPSSPKIEQAWFGLLNWVLLLAFIGGAVFTYLHARKLFFISLAILIINLGVSALHLYAFRNRLILYLIPIVFLFAGMFVERLFLIGKVWVKISSYLIASLLIGILLFEAASIFINPIDNSNLKNALSFLENEIQPGDYVTTNRWAFAPYAYYRRFYNLKSNPVTSLIADNNSTDEYLQSICQGRMLGRTWIIYTEEPNAEAKFIDKLMVIRPPLESWNSDHAGVYLFDFSDLEMCGNIEMNNK